MPESGGEVQATRFHAAPGGGFAFLRAGRRAGADIVHCCPHGTGPNGDVVRAALARENIPAALEPDPRGDTGHCVVLIAPDGERTLVSVPGVESRVAAGALGGARAGDVAVLSGYALRDARELPGFLAALPAAAVLVFDPTPLVAALARDAVDAVLARADWVSGNRAEIDALPAPAGGVVLRDGANGAWLIEQGHAPVRFLAPRVTPRDTTGAGDVHVATFAALLAQGAGASTALEAANAAAAAHVAGGV
ncbi:MAG: PfkB family carbohydrate kinase [Tagaea sp.]|nr:PfkB family carbohydrate kinase [Tagaea sp.]